MTSECGAHAECVKNYKILLWQPYFGSNSPLYEAKLLSNAQGIPWGRIIGFGSDWYIMNLTSINMRKICQRNLMLISLSVIAFLGDSMSNYFFVTTFSNSTLYFACRFDELCSSEASILEVSNLTY